MSREKNSKLREWIIVLSSKDWMETASVVDAGLIYISPVSRIALGNIIKYQKKLKTLVQSDKRGDEFELENFKKITKQNVTAKDWGNIKSEIPKACYLYKKIQIIKGKHISSDLDMQAFFLENRMDKNLASTNNINEKNINKTKIDDSFQGFELTRSILLQLNDISYKNNRKDILREKKKSDKKIVSLDDWQDAVELFYHENKLMVLCEKVGRSIFQSNQNISEDEKIWDELIPEQYLNFPQIKIYAKVYRMLKHRSEKTFYEIKDLLVDENIQGKLSPKYLGEIYRYLINYCVFKVNQGEKKYINLYLDFTQILMDKNLLLQQGEIPIWNFKNIVKVAVKSNRITWAENFVQTAKNKIDKVEKKAIVEYCMALINYKQGNFKEAYNLINYQPLSKDPLIRVDTLILLLHIYLDYDPHDSFYSRRNNLRSMINSKSSISDSIMNKWRLTLSKISKIQSVVDKEALKEMQEEIMSDIKEGNFYAGREWMLDFINRKI